MGASPNEDLACASELPRAGRGRGRGAETGVTAVNRENRPLRVSSKQNTRGLPSGFLTFIAIVPEHVTSFAAVPGIQPHGEEQRLVVLNDINRNPYQPACEKWNLSVFTKTSVLKNPLVELVLKST